MQGGEVFVPKIPSLKIVDLATAMAPGIPHKIIGVRPGEKIHEVMCPIDDSHLTFEFKDHFVIAPSIIFNDSIDNDYSTNMLNENGTLVEPGSEYSSGKNTHFLSLDEINLFNSSS